MSNPSTITQSQVADVSSERAVRSVPTRRRRGAVAAMGATGVNRRRSAQRSFSGSAPLRRWSVAELIARANGAPRATV